MPINPEQCRLNDLAHSDYYHFIVGKLFAENTLSAHPRVVLLGGQPGSGKTKMRDWAVDELPSVAINADDLRDYHPMYKKLKLSEPARASFLVNEDVSLWTQKLIRQAVDEKRNIVFDGTFGSSDKNMLHETLTMFRENGYTSELWALAVPAEFSKLGIYLRNETQIQQTGTGRFVSMKVHDLNYRNIPANIEMAVKNSLVDRVSIFSRSVTQEKGSIVNNKVQIVHSLDKTDAAYRQAADLFLQTRNEPLSPLLKTYFTVRFKEIAGMIDKRLNQAVKANNVEKVQSVTQYKNQFLEDLGMNRKGYQEMTLGS